MLDTATDQSASGGDCPRLFPLCVVTQALMQKRAVGVVQGSDVEVGDPVVAKILREEVAPEKQKKVKTPLTVQSKQNPS